MHIATRIAFTRSPARAADGHMLALALASGIAGLAVTYPAFIAGAGSAGEWIGRLEVKPPSLAMPTISPDVSITAKFQDTVLALTNAAKTGGAGLTGLPNVLVPTSSSGAVTGLTGRGAPQALSNPVDGTDDPAARLVPSKSPVHGSLHVAPEAGLPALVPAAVEPAAGEARIPLDAVRITLPPASTEPVITGAMLPEAALSGIAAASAGSPLPVAGIESQSLAAGAQPEPAPVSAPGRLADTPPFSLLSASREVREFDLAALDKTRPAAATLARALVETRPPAAASQSSHGQNLPSVAKVLDRVVGDFILHVAGLSLEGVPSGNLSVRIGMSGDLSIKLADLMAPVRDQMAPATFERLVNSSAASEYVSFANLRAAGFDIRYDAGDDRLMVSAQP